MGKIKSSKFSHRKIAKENLPYNRNNSRRPSPPKDSSDSCGVDSDNDHKSSSSDSSSHTSSSWCNTGHMMCGEAGVKLLLGPGEAVKKSPASASSRTMPVTGVMQGSVTGVMPTASSGMMLTHSSQLKYRHVTPGLQVDKEMTTGCVMEPPRAPRILANSQRENYTDSIPKSLSQGTLITPHQTTTFYLGLPTPPTKIDLQQSQEQEPLGPDYFSKISDELVLMIFQWLSRQVLSRCLRVCKRWHRIGLDESLWRRVDLAQTTVKALTIGTLFRRGTAYLRLSRADIIGIKVIEQRNAIRMSCVRYLDLSMVTIKTEMLCDLLAHCRELRKLSLELVTVNSTVFHLLADNPELDTLNLSMCEGVTEDGLLLLLAHCQRLENLNLAWTGLDRDSVAYVCSNLPCSLRTLNLSGCRDEIFDDDVAQLVTCCPNLEDLDLSDALNLTEASIQYIQEGLDRLVQLSLSRCYNIAQSYFSLLHSIASLQVLNVMGMLQSGALELLRKTMPSVLINKMPFSIVARPTVGPHVRSIWGQKVWKNIPSSTH